jgi:hypothetical protein
MELKSRPWPEVTEDLLDAIRTFPTVRQVEHCGTLLQVSPLDFYARCPHCGDRIKLRSFSGGAEIEDVFDAVLEWMNQPTAEAIARSRRAELEAEE